MTNNRDIGISNTCTGSEARANHVTEFKSTETGPDEVLSADRPTRPHLVQQRRRPTDNENSRSQKTLDRPKGWLRF